MALPGDDPNLLPLQRFVAPFIVLLWATSTFWIPLLAILFVWKELQRGRMATIRACGRWCSHLACMSR
jgi:hypothetical protein